MAVLALLYEGFKFDILIKTHTERGLIKRKYKDTNNKVFIIVDA